MVFLIFFFGQYQLPYNFKKKNKKIIIQKNNFKFLTSFSAMVFLIFFSDSTIQRAKENMMAPWPMSPNITPNRNGKVAQVYRPKKQTFYFFIYFLFFLFFFIMIILFFFIYIPIIFFCYYLFFSFFKIYFIFLFFFIYIPILFILFIYLFLFIFLFFLYFFIFLHILFIFILFVFFKIYIIGALSI